MLSLVDGRLAPIPAEARRTPLHRLWKHQATATARIPGLYSFSECVKRSNPNEDPTSCPDVRAKFPGLAARYVFAGTSTPGRRRESGPDARPAPAADDGNA